MAKNLLKTNISSETMAAIFIVIFVSLFILANLLTGFSWPLFALAMLVAFVISIFSPQSGLLAIIFLTMVFERFFTLQSFYVGKVEYKLYPLDIIMAGVIIGLLPIIFDRSKRVLKKLGKPEWLLIAFIVLNVLYFIVDALIIKSDFALSFSSLKNYGFYSLMYFIVIFSVRNEADLKRIVKFFLAGGVAIIFFIIFGIINGGGLWTEYTPLSTSGVRILAFTHGLYLSIILIPTFLYLALRQKNNLLMFLAGVWTIGVIGSLMRHLWVALGIVLAYVYYLVSRESREWLRKISYRFLVPFALIFVFVSYLAVMDPQSKMSDYYQGTLGVFSQRVGSLTNVSADESFAWRSLVWKTAYAQYKTDPIFGIGTGRRVYVETENYKDYIEVRDMHNSFVSIAVQFGLVGIVIFIWFIFEILTHLYREIKKRPEHWFFLGILGVILLYLIVFFFQPYLETNLLAIFFWLTLGLARISNEIIKADENPRNQ